MIIERDKKSNHDRNNIYLKYQLMLSKVTIFNFHKEDKVNITELYKTEVFPRYE